MKFEYQSYKEIIVKAVHSITNIQGIAINEECKKSAGQWPISDHFSKMANLKISAWCIHFVHMAHQIPQ